MYGWLLHGRYGYNTMILCNNAPIDVERALELIKLRAWKWAKVKVQGFDAELFEWLMHPRSILKLDGPFAY